jgi:hypothetical protein
LNNLSFGEKKKKRKEKKRKEKKRKQDPVLALGVPVGLLYGIDFVSFPFRFFVSRSNQFSLAILNILGIQTNSRRATSMQTNFIWVETNRKDAPIFQNYFIKSCGEQRVSLIHLAGHFMV